MYKKLYVSAICGILLSCALCVNEYMIATAGISISGGAGTLQQVTDKGSTTTTAVTLGDVTMTNATPVLTITGTSATDTSATISKSSVTSALTLDNGIIMQGPLGSYVLENLTQYASSAAFVQTATGSWSMSYWTRCTPSTGKQGCTVMFYDTGATSAKGFYIQVSGGPTTLGTVPFIDSGGNGRYQSFNLNSVWSSTEFQHIVVTHTGGTDAIALYHNGVSVATFGGTNPQTWASSPYNNTILLHAFSTELTTAVPSNYNDLRIYNSVLAQADVDALYADGMGTQSEANGLGTNLQAHYRFDSNLVDSVGAYNLTNFGGAETYSATASTNIETTAAVLSSIDGSGAGERGILTVGDSYGTTNIAGSVVFTGGFTFPTATPTVVLTGSAYYNSTANIVYIYDGSNWKAH